jgi:hypothetical protein
MKNQKDASPMLDSHSEYTMFDTFLSDCFGFPNHTLQCEKIKFERVYMFMCTAGTNTCETRWSKF